MRDRAGTARTISPTVVSGVIFFISLWCWRGRIVGYSRARPLFCKEHSSLKMYFKYIFYLSFFSSGVTMSLNAIEHVFRLLDPGVDAGRTAYPGAGDGG